MFLISGSPKPNPNNTYLFGAGVDKKSPVLSSFLLSTQVELGRKQEVVVYDQNSKEVGHLSKDGFVQILMGKLESTFHRVSLLTGNLCV